MRLAVTNDRVQKSQKTTSDTPNRNMDRNDENRIDNTCADHSQPSPDGINGFPVARIPLVIDPALLNTDSVDTAKAQSADVDDVMEQLLSVASVAAQTIAEQRARINFLERLTVTDELTGLLNRRGFDEATERVLAQASRYDESGMLAIIDLDDFKSINDNHGHAVGDAVLKHVANLLLHNTRSTDYVARLGGDEFAVLYVRAEKMPTRARAQSIVRSLNNSTLILDNVKIPIKASVGLHNYGPNTDRAALLDSADLAMYDTKSKRKTVA